MKHDDLVKISAKWLHKHTSNILVPNCSVVISDTKTAARHGETPDVIGFNSHTSVLLEIKTSWNDFMNDRHKPFRKEAHKGMGQFRYYVCPEKLIFSSHVPKSWGLIWYDHNLKSLGVIKSASMQPCDIESERSVLVSIMRRKKIRFYP